MRYGRKNTTVPPLKEETLKEQTLKEAPPKEQKITDQTRRNFLAVSTLSLALGATDLRAQRDSVAMKVDGGLAVLIDRKIPNRSTALVPPGARCRNNFKTKCTACQLCVSVCPNGVLRPSTKLDKYMQPEMSYERGYCRPECVKCSEVCPTGAIKKITKVDKTAISIGRAVWIEKNCLVFTENMTCGNCAKHCPAVAIQMVDYDATRKIPAVDTYYCIGCGACEHLCPATPFSAIYVEGSRRHRTI